MAYASLKLHHFRSYGEHEVFFSPFVTIIVGPNGSGKTNLLEALYVLSHGTSFRVSDKDLLQHGQTWFRLQGTYGDQERILTYDSNKLPVKQYKFDGVKRQRLSHAQRVGVVLFEPDELRLLHGAPARRRDYLDALLMRLWPEATRIKHQFERALLQRNNILKHADRFSKASLEDQLFVWNIKFAEYAERLLGYRWRVIELCNQSVSELYTSIAGSKTEVRLQYKSDVPPDNYKIQLLEGLQTKLAEDMRRGFTSLGPHREDFVVWMDGKDTSTAASRGEIRTVVLALKMIELRLLHSYSNRPPLLLLDDVFSELDAARRQALAELASQYQTIITTTDADAVSKYFEDERVKAISTVR